MKQFVILLVESVYQRVERPKQLRSPKVRDVLVSLVLVHGIVGDISWGGRELEAHGSEERQQLVNDGEVFLVTRGMTFSVAISLVKVCNSTDTCPKGVRRTCRAAEVAGRSKWSSSAGRLKLNKKTQKKNRSFTLTIRTLRGADETHSAACIT
jgi:hypothetical protein